MSNEFDMDLSLNGYRWKLKNSPDHLVLAMQQKAGINELLSRIMVGKNIQIDDVEDFLNPTIKRFLPDPLHLLDMDKAIDRIYDAVIKRQKIVIFGDYDVDGATSSASFKRFFNSIDFPVQIYIPDRIKDGYGPSSLIFQNLKNEKTDLVITVDCGTSAFDALETANKIGLDVIVVDHHQSTENLPIACAIVNPNRIDETSTYKTLAAVGVTFLVIVGLSSKLKNLGYFKDKSVPNLLNLLDLVALGTVCDVVALNDINRAFVVQGLKILAKRSNIGLSALIDISGIQESPSAYHLGFILGPRINAGGRVGEARLGADLLSCNNESDAIKIAEKLHIFNEERRAIENLLLEEAITIVEKNSYKNMIFIVGNNWHPGIIGIIASKLKDRYNLPVIVISLVDGIGKASCRSVTGIDMGATIINAKMLDLVENGGGHAMAAGFSVLENKIETLKEYLEEKFEAIYLTLSDLNLLYFDGHISLEGVNNELAKTIEKLGPFGTSNSEPKFVISNCTVVKPQVTKSSHITCLVKSNASGKNKFIKAMAFRAADTSLGRELMNPLNNLSLVCNVKINYWKGSETLQLNIIDVIKSN